MFLTTKTGTGLRNLVLDEIWKLIGLFAYFLQ